MTRIVDLTMTLPQVPVYPGHPDVEIWKVRSFEVHGKEVRKLVLGTHTGTHIDAPRHYIEGGGTVEDIPLDVLCGPATLNDLSFVSTPVIPADFRGIKSVERVLLRFDGEKHLGSMDYYTKQPWLTEDAARWLVNNGCKVLGMDIPMPDSPQDMATMPIHKILLGAGVVLVEYMVNLSAIKADTFDLIVAPLKIRDGDGAPARCFAIVR